MGRTDGRLNYRKLKQQLFESGTSQRALARLVHIDEALFSKQIRGLRRQHPDLASRVEKVLGLAAGVLR